MMQRTLESSRIAVDEAGLRHGVERDFWGNIFARFDERLLDELCQVDPLRETSTRSSIKRACARTLSRMIPLAFLTVAGASSISSSVAQTSVAFSGERNS